MITWLKPATDKVTYTCPDCLDSWRFIDPRNPFRWQCPKCETWLTWRETEQFEPIKVKVCRSCGADMVKRNGQYGAFWGCEQNELVQYNVYKQRTGPSGLAASEN
jgi:DNA-directed RNA polymerase subunit M/transcription elongation factor TFIIS